MSFRPLESNLSDAQFHAGNARKALEQALAQAPDELTYNAIERLLFLVTTVQKGSKNLAARRRRQRNRNRREQPND